MTAIRPPTKRSHPTYVVAPRGVHRPARRPCSFRPAAFGAGRELRCRLRQGNRRASTLVWVDRRRRARDVHAGRASLFLEIGFSRGKNVGCSRGEDPHQLLAISSAGLVDACGFAIAFGGSARSSSAGRQRLLLPASATTSTERWASRRRLVLQRRLGGVLLLPVRVLRRVAGDRLGHDPGADQVHRLSDLRRGLLRRSSTRWSRTGSSAAASWPPTIGSGVQDFAGSTVVHLSGATGALRGAASLLGREKAASTAATGEPRAIPGHNMPLFGLGVHDPVARLVRLQPRLDAGHGRQPLRRGRRA